MKQDNVAPRRDASSSNDGRPASFPVANEVKTHHCFIKTTI